MISFNIGKITLDQDAYLKESRSKLSFTLFSLQIKCVSFSMKIGLNFTHIKGYDSHEAVSNKTKPNEVKSETLERPRSSGIKYAYKDRCIEDMSVAELS